MSSLSFILTPPLFLLVVGFCTRAVSSILETGQNKTKIFSQPCHPRTLTPPQLPTYETWLLHRPRLITSQSSQHSTLPPTQVWNLLLTVSSSLSPPFRNFWFSCLLTFQEDLVSLNQPSLKLFPAEHDNFCIIFSERRGGCRKWPVPTNCIWKFQHREVAVENHH